MENVKMARVPKAISRLSAIPVKICINICFIRLEKSILKFIQKHKRTWIAKVINSEQKDQHCRYHNTKVQIILQSDSNKTSTLLAQNKTCRSVGYNRRPRNKPTQYSHLILDIGARNICWRKDSLLSKWCWDSRRFQM
jgi:hypothetical protein